MALFQDQGKNMNRIEKICKIFLVVYNITMLVAGLCIIVLCCWILLGRAYIGHLIAQHIYLGLLYLFIASSAFTVVISFLGCFGATYELKWMLYLYGGILLVLFVIFLSTCVSTLVARENAVKLIKNSLKKTMKSYPQKESSSDAWDYMQKQFKCCGIDSYEDWNGNIPSSCCKNEAPDCDVTDTQAINLTGCYDSFSEYISSHLLHICILGLIISSFKILGMSSAFVLGDIIKHQRRRLPFDLRFQEL
ncbi:hypothetical protein J437_LFUL009956 [Ladona fulva]|uniref:Tetraspanin n=1 Tax=Ladona fulva TaxID=123851 RepID=A0A8K0P2C0_LADFU|nr:hypothetical protein J437_LFUL009956 [Ladona fulva]